MNDDLCCMCLWVHMYGSRDTNSGCKGKSRGSHTYYLELDHGHLFNICVSSIGWPAKKYTGRHVRLQVVIENSKQCG